MPETEPRYACPVCLGVPLNKLRLKAQGDLLLDYCQRCGGIWFDAGEIPQLRRYHPQVLWRHIVLHDKQYNMTCHACYGRIPRHASHCPACRWRNVIDCPVCALPLRPLERDGLKLDLCQACKGVWFDNIELAEIWNRQLASRTSKLSRKTDANTEVDGVSLFLDVLTRTPVDVIEFGVNAGVQGGQIMVEVAAQAISNVPNSLGVVVEAIGDLAENVFATIASIIGDIFDNF